MNVGGQEDLMESRKTIQSVFSKDSLNFHSSPRQAKQQIKCCVLRH